MRLRTRPQITITITIIIVSLYCCVHHSVLPRPIYQRRREMNGCHEADGLRSSVQTALKKKKRKKKKIIQEGLVKLLNAPYSTQTGPSISIMVLETPGRAMETMDSIRHDCVWRFISICHRPMNWEGFGSHVEIF